MNDAHIWDVQAGFRRDARDERYELSLCLKVHYRKIYPKNQKVFCAFIDLPLDLNAFCMPAINNYLHCWLQSYDRLQRYNGCNVWIEAKIGKRN